MIVTWWRCLLYSTKTVILMIVLWWRCLLYSTKTVRLMIVIWWRCLLYGTKTVRLMIVIWWRCLLYSTKNVRLMITIWWRRQTPLPVSSVVCVAQFLVFCVVFCRSLLVLLSLFFWSLCCLSFDLRLLIIPLVSFGHCVVCHHITIIKIEQHKPH
jgi:hypothetical protein